MKKYVKALGVVFLALTLVVVQTAFSEIGTVSAGSNGIEGTLQYTYSSTDPLYAATHFHIFAHNRVDSGAHTHGNIACAVYSGSEFGTRKSFFSTGVSNEISYIRDIENSTFNSASVAGTLVLGKDWSITSEPGASQTTVENKTTGSSTRLDAIKDNQVYIEKEGNYVIDLDAEFAKLNARSLEWAKKADTGTVDGSLTNSEIDCASADMSSGYTFVNVSYDDWKACGNGIEIKNVDSSDGTGIIVINMDLAGQTEANLSLTGNGLKVIDRNGNTIGNEEVSANEYGTARVVFNFYNGSGGSPKAYTGKLDVGNVFVGSVLAPSADVTIGALNGTVVGKNVTHTGAESHRRDLVKESGNGLTTVTVSTATPTPTPTATATATAKPTKKPTPTPTSTTGSDEDTKTTATPTSDSDSDSTDGSTGGSDEDSDKTDENQTESDTDENEDEDEDEDTDVEGDSDSKESDDNDTDVEGATDNKKSNLPKTGDKKNVLPIFLLDLSACGYLILISKKK